MRGYLVLTASGFCALCCPAHAVTPRPVQVPVSTEWFGYDGSWSTVNMRVGSPQQWVSLFPNTIGQETWVIGESGCDDTLACIVKRGGIFKSNESTTWSAIGAYALNFQPALGDSGWADYGLDTISIGDSISVPRQIVGVINSTQFLLGSLGLGVVPSSFITDNQPTFLSSMVQNQSAIPSHSYGYTAGAYYRLKGVPASLTLGGVDLNRFVPNDISFDMASDFQPVVSINAISVSSEPLSTSTTRPNWTQQPLSLLGSSQAQLFTIDSSTPFLWLPEKVCDAFAMALNLTYNSTLGLYLYDNGTDPSVLADWNMTFTFTLADLPESSKTVEIRLPYDAFNHQLSFPFPPLNATVSSSPINYFPLRRASNNTQYTIGRVFLQEAYLAVDYERNNFSLSQAKFANDALSNVKLASITRPPGSIFAGPVESSDGRLSIGAKAGIGVGIALLVIAAVGLTVLYFRKRKSGKGGAKANTEISERKSNGDEKAPAADASELLGDERHPQEAPADKANTRFELPGSGPVELAAEIPALYTAPGKARHSAALAELEPQNPSPRNSIPHNIHRTSPSPSLPPYSPAQVGRSPGSNPSHSSTMLNGSAPGTDTLSSGISGITPNGASRSNVPPNESSGQRTGSSSAHAISTPGPSPLLPPTRLNKPDSRSSLSLPGSRGDDRSMPARNVSRSSRFREEGISTETQRPSQPPRRFSWEDG